MMIRILITVLISISLIKTEASSKTAIDARDKIAQINISILDNSIPDKTTVEELGALLNTLSAGEKLSESKNEINELTVSYKLFKTNLEGKQSADSLKKLFRDVNNKFNSVFGNYFLEELKKSSKKKIIIFSTSMSCECTFEMCYKQETEIQKLLKEKLGLFEYAVVDCYKNFDLQSKYEVGFIPVVLVLDEKSKEVKRFVREENLYSKLSEYLLEK